MPNTENITDIEGGDLMGQVRGNDDGINATSAPGTRESDLVILKEHGERAPSSVSKLSDKRTFSSVIVKITHKNYIFMGKGRKGLQDFFIEALWFTCRRINRMKLNPPAIDEDFNGTMASNFLPLFKPIKVVISDRKWSLTRKPTPGTSLSI